MQSWAHHSLQAIGLPAFGPQFAHLQMDTIMPTSGAGLGDQEKNIYKMVPQTTEERKGNNNFISSKAPSG